MNKVIAIEDVELSKRGEKRYVLVDKETGEVLDNAQGYGYKSPTKAYKCYCYKMRDKSKDKLKEAREQEIREWMKNNKSFVNLMDALSFDIAKGAACPDDKFDAVYVRELLKERNMEVTFTAGELLKVWSGK